MAVVAVDNRVVSIQGNFIGIVDPALLNYRVLVIGIKIGLVLFASVNRHRVMTQK